MLAALTCLMTGGGIMPAIAGDEPSALRYQTYVDVGYAASNRDPSDDNWPGKTSTATLNELTLNLAMANIGRDASRDARWGFELGLQAGDDSKRRRAHEGSGWGLPRQSLCHVSADDYSSTFDSFFGFRSIDANLHRSHGILSENTRDGDLVPAHNLPSV